MEKILIIYYSRKGQNYVNGRVQDLVKGNTEIVAETIQKLVGGDLFEIETVKVYPADFRACVDLARLEIEYNIRPELKSYPANFEEYDVIFLCFPIWFGIPPMAIATFLEHYDFSGKKIFPVTTHDGSGLGGSIKFLKRTCPSGIIVARGLAVLGAEVNQSAAQIERWLKNFF